MTILLRALAIFSVLLLPALAKATPIEQYHRVEDGTDFAPAFDRALLECAGKPCTIELGRGPYVLDRTVEVCTTVHVVGTGFGAVMQGSPIYVSGRFTAFRTWPTGKCPNAAFAKHMGSLYGQSLTIANLNALPLNAAGTPGEAPHYGVEARTSVFLTDVGISGFAQGVRMLCDIKLDRSNCSGSLLINVAVVMSEHAGILLQGGDSNAVTIIGGRSDTNCRNAARWNAGTVANLCSRLPNHAVCVTPRLQCAGYLDLSFLGGTFVGTVAHAENGSSGYVHAGSNQTSTIVGAYAEADTWPGWADSRNTVLGGGNRFEGPAGQLKSSTMPGLTVTDGTATIALGRDAARPNAVWAISGPGTSVYPFKLVIGPNGQMTQFIGNSGKVVGTIPWGPPP